MTEYIVNTLVFLLVIVMDSVCSRAFDFYFRFTAKINLMTTSCGEELQTLQENVLKVQVKI